MRLIDRDEMLSPKIWDMNIPNDVPKVVHDSLFELYNRLIHIPTVDAEPIRHGHWEKVEETNGNYYHYECSKCGEKPLNDNLFGECMQLSFYCPHCGAKMDEVEKDV